MIPKIEEKFLDFIKKYIFEILLFLTVIVSLLIRINFLKFKSDDYIAFLSEWFNILKTNGRIFALKNSIGDYNIPYLVIMALITYLPIKQLVALKIVSIIFDYLMAFAGMLIIYELLKNNRNKDLYALITFLIITLLPTVFLNSSAWCQCDSIYTTFVLFSILYLLKEKYTKAFIFFGIAFAFKLQTIFALPIFLLVYLSKKNYSLIEFFIIPIVNFIMSLPAIIVGKPIKECFSIYFNQTTQYSNYLAMNFPSIYAIFFKVKAANLIENPSLELSKAGTFITLIILAGTAAYFLIRNIKINQKLIIEIFLWSVMIVTFLLPHMHDRYLFIADVISVIYFIIYPKRFYIPIAVNFISLYTYIVYLYKVIVIPMSYVAILFGVIIIIMTKYMIEDIKEYQIQEE